MKPNRKRGLACCAAAVLCITATPAFPSATVSAASLLRAEFETTNDSFTGRGGAAVAWTSDEAYQGECSLAVTDRTASWNGASRDASSLLKAGQTYHLSCAAMQKSGEAVEMKFSLQYEDSTGETAYDQIALETAESGEWTMLDNTAYTVPDGAKSPMIYVETTESLTDFYLDTVQADGSPAVIKRGDANGDLMVNVSDAVSLAKFLTRQLDTVELGADMNEDNAINGLDMILLKQALLYPKTSTISGDWDNYQETVSPQMLQVYKDSLCSIGNTARIRDKIAKAQSGEPVTIGYLGGSITGGGSSSSEANRFVNLSAQYFSETFGTGNNVKFVNAGMAGTSSVVGNIRVDQDIFAKNADIIFIEFAVNDQGGDRFQKSFESLVKKCLMQENEPAVAVITLCQQSGGSNQDWMEKVAKNYQVPVISGRDAIMNGIKAGTLSWNDYGSGDTLHPGNGGHKLISEFIGYYYRQALRSEHADSEYTIPTTTVFGDEYATAKLVDYSALQNLSTGSFNKGSNNPSYPNGFTNSKNGNNPLTFTVNGKGFMLLFQSNSNASMGTVVIDVNGKKREVSSNLLYTWGGLDADLGYYQDTPGELKVSISMKDPSTTFVMYGIAVIQ